MNLDLQWTQTPDQIIIKDVPLPFGVQGIDIKLTNATIRVVDMSGNTILEVNQKKIWNIWYKIRKQKNSRL